MNYALEGRRVQLERCDDPYTELRPGDLGIVTGEDDAGQLMVRWDSGSTLSLIREAGDRWTILD